MLILFVKVCVLVLNKLIVNDYIEYTFLLCFRLNTDSVVLCYLTKHITQDQDQRMTVV